MNYEEAIAVLQQLTALPAAMRSATPPASAAHEPHPQPSAAGAQPTIDSVGKLSLLATAQLHSLLEAVPDALVIINTAGVICLVNSHTEQLFGYRREELLGQPIELLVPERFRERHVHSRSQFFTAPHRRPMGAGLELYGRRRDGRDIPVEISLNPLHSAEGLFVVSSIRDISERKRTEAQLRKMEARYRTLVEGIPAVTFMAALDEGVNELYVSPQIEELLGFSQREWLDDPILWFARLHPDDRQRWHTEFAHTCATGEPFQSIYRFVARDGRVVWVRGEAKVVLDDDGRPLFLQGIAFDITSMKEAEEELRTLNQTLEQRVAERTAIAESRATELARSNAALAQFGYVVAHDLRQPLRTIKSYTQKLAAHHQGADPQVVDYLTRSINAADRMRILIDDLLAYSRVQTQGKPPAPIASAATLNGACANLQAALEECAAEVTADTMPMLRADETQLVQLFQNLISNALKFRAEGRPPRIHVGAQREGAWWRLSITDNGIGVEPQYLQRIFGLGERLHSISKYPGNGIGLATCEKIVQRHGGRIWAESPGLDRGCTFCFTLPAGAEGGGRGVGSGE